MAGFNLTFSQRKRIEKLYSENKRPCDIAKKIGVTTQTIYRELKRGATGGLDKNFRPVYAAELGEKNVKESMRRRGRKKTIK